MQLHPCVCPAHEPGVLMLIGLQGIDPAAEGLANGDSADAPKAAGAPPVDLAQSFRSRGVQGSIAIGNLAELLESEDELTRFTAAKVLLR